MKIQNYEVFSIQQECDRMVEIVKNHLYFAIIKGLSGKKIRSTTEAIYFSIDDDYMYQNYYYDFGPYNISYLYKYCLKLNKYLQFSKGQKRIVHCTSTNPEKKANAACLIGAFCVIYLKIPPGEVYKTLIKAGPYKQFLDASQCPCQYTLGLESCLQGVYKALLYNFFNFDDFDVIHYDMYDKLQFGDMNWLLPRKFLAFIGPNTADYLTGHPPDFYLKYFHKNDVKTVVRLNSKTYDARVFTQAGIEHYDLIYADGTTPSREILLRFLQIVESAPAAIAVHCKAGLGRTGSLIGAYLIKHYKMTAKEAIAWMRICRPGSVIGQQQGWLMKLEAWLWKMGSQYRGKHFGKPDVIPRHKYGIYSKMWPIEREKIIKEAKRKMITKTSISDQQAAISKPRWQSGGIEDPKLRAHRFRKKSSSKTTMTYKSFKDSNDLSKILSSVHGIECEDVAHYSLTTQPITPEQKSRFSSESWTRPSRRTPKLESGSVCFDSKTFKDMQGDIGYSKNACKCVGSNRSRIMAPKSMNKMDDIDNCSSKDIEDHTAVKSYVERLRENRSRQGKPMTQGDRLNHIKIMKQKNFEGEDNLMGSYSERPNDVMSVIQKLKYFYTDV